MKLRKWGLMLALPVLASMLAGCTKQDWQDLADFAKTWAREHKLLNEDGNPNYVAIGGRTVFGTSTGDEQTDAVIDGGTVVKNFEEAEKLSEEASESGDKKKVDQAIRLRPGEFRYYNQRGAMLLLPGKSGWEKDFAEADELAARYGKASQLRNLDSRINFIHSEYYSNDILNTNQKIRYNQAMHKAYYQRFLLTNDPQDKEQSDHYKKAFQELGQA